MAELKSTIKLDTNDTKAAAGMKRMTAEAAALVKQLEKANSEMEKIGRVRRGGASASSSFVGPQAPAGSRTSKGVTITPEYQAQITAAKEVAKAEKAAALESARVKREARQASAADARRVAQEEAAAARAAAKAVAAAEREKVRAVKAAAAERAKASKEALAKEVSAYRTRLQATRQVEAQAYSGASPSARRDIDVGRLNASSKAAGISLSDPRYTTALDGINKRFEAATKSAAGLSTAVSGVASAVGLLVGVSTAMDLAKRAVEAGDSYVNLRARLLIATGSMAEAGKAQAEVVRIAAESGTQLEAVGALYVRIAMNSKELGITSEQTVRAVQLVGKAIQVSGASASESAAATQQFAQALAAGRLNGDELRSILENAPRLAKAIADGLGVPVGKLKELGEQGVLSSKLVLQSLASQGEALDAEFAKLPVTVARASQQAKNALGQYVGEVMNSAGATTSLGGAISALSENMGLVVGAGSVVATILATVALRTGAASLGMTKLTTDMTTAALSSTRFAGAASALNLALGLLPAVAMAATVAIVAVGKAAADSAEQTALSINRMSDAVIDANRKFKSYQETGSKADLASGVLGLRRAEKEGEAKLVEKNKQLSGLGFFSSAEEKARITRERDLLAQEYNNTKQQRTIAEGRAEAAGMDLANMGKVLQTETQRELADNKRKALNEKYLTDEEQFQKEKKALDDSYRESGIANFANDPEYKKRLAVLTERADKKKPKVKSLEAKEFSNVKAEAEAQFNLVVEQQRELSAIRKQDLDEGKISYQKYVDGVVAGEKLVYDAKVKSLNAQRSEAQTALGSKDKGVALKADTEIKKIDGELKVAEEKNKNARVSAQREVQEEIRRTKFELEDLMATEAQAGRRLSPEQISAQANRAFFDREREAAKLGDPKYTAGVAAAKNRYAVGLKIDVDKQTIDDAFDQVDIVTQRLNLAVQNGELGSIQANQGIQAANMLALKSAQALLPEMERLAKTMGLDAVVAVEKYKLKIEELKREIDPVATKINETFGNSLENATKSLIRGQMTFREAFFSIFDNVAEELAGTASKSISSWITNSIKGGGFDLGAWLSGLMGTTPNKNPVAATASSIFPGESGGILDKVGLGGGAGGLPLDPATGAMRVTMATGVDGLLGTGGGDNAGGGMFSGIWDKAKTIFGDFTNSIGGIFGSFGSGFSSLLSSFGSSFSSLLGSVMSSLGGGGGGGSWVGSLVGAFAGAFANGGEIHGPGTSRSDSMWAKVSTGEFVVNAAGVKAFGVDRLHDINRLGHGGYQPRAGKSAFADGGLVNVPLAAAEGGGGGGMAVRIVNQIDPEMVGDYLATPAGEKVLLNRIKSNAQSIKTLLGR